MSVVETSPALERIIFGDNQFFGVNHMSEERARAQSIRFRSTGSIMNVLRDAYDSGIRAFMCTTHDQIASVCGEVKANEDKFAGFRFYPCMPYAHKYANAFTELGPMEAIKRFLPKDGGITALLSGGLSAASGDVRRVVELLVDAEMAMFAGLETPVIFLQNVVTDLVLGLGVYDAFGYFADHVSKRYKAEPAFITMNMPKLVPVLESLGIARPIVCANINASHFRMCGGEDAYVEVIASGRVRPIAMSIFASGAISAPEAVRYLQRFPRLEAAVFGASTKNNISQTTQLLTSLFST